MPISEAFLDFREDPVSLIPAAACVALTYTCCCRSHTLLHRGKHIAAHDITVQTARANCVYYERTGMRNRTAVFFQWQGREPVYHFHRRTACVGLESDFREYARRSIHQESDRFI